MMREGLLLLWMIARVEGSLVEGLGKDLVACVLISFVYEHIRMWRGKYWKSSLPPPEDDNNEAVELIADDSTTTLSSVLELEVQQSVELLSERSSNEELVSVTCHENVTQTEHACAEDHLDLSNNGKSSDDELSPEMFPHSLPVNGSSVVEKIKDSHRIEDDAENMIPTTRPRRECLDGIMLLLRQPFESGSAVILDDEVPLDANIVYERSVALAKLAPPGPVFQHKINKAFVRKSKKEKTQNDEKQNVEAEAIAIPEKRSSNEKKKS